MRNNSVTATFMGVCLAAVGFLGGCQIRPGAEITADGIKATKTLTNEQIAVILYASGQKPDLHAIAKAKARPDGDVFAQFGITPPPLGEKRVSLLPRNAGQSGLALQR